MLSTDSLNVINPVRIAYSVLANKQRLNTTLTDTNCYIMNLLIHGVAAFLAFRALPIPYQNNIKCKDARDLNSRSGLFSFSSSPLQYSRTKRWIWISSCYLPKSPTENRQIRLGLHPTTIASAGPTYDIQSIKENSELREHQSMSECNQQWQNSRKVVEAVSLPMRRLEKLWVDGWVTVFRHSQWEKGPRTKSAYGNQRVTCYLLA